MQLKDLPNNQLFVLGGWDDSVIYRKLYNAATIEKMTVLVVVAYRKIDGAWVDDLYNYDNSYLIPEADVLPVKVKVELIDYD